LKEKNQKKEEPSEKEEQEEKKEAPQVTNVLFQSTVKPEMPLTDYSFGKAGKTVQGRILVTPLAKKLAEQKGIDLSSVKGTGPNGRIVKDDLDKGLLIGKASFNQKEGPQIPPGTYEEEPLTQIKKVVGQRLQEAKTFIPHFYVMQEVDCSSMIKLRAELKGGGLKITYNDLIIRGSALALRESPKVNSGFYPEKNTILRFKTVDISIAVSMEEGLITPIIRHADFKNLGEISSEMKDLAKRARTGELAREEYMGGSFTISNLGMFGVTNFVGIINPPQAAILSVGGIYKKLQLVDGKIEEGSFINLTLSADHRVLDGADGAQFLNNIKNYLENASMLLLH